MEPVQEDTIANSKLGGGVRDDERDADYDKDEHFNVGGEVQPCLKKVF